MNTTIELRPYNENDLDQCLALIERSDSTNRSKDTWLGNDMTAMLAFDEQKLIGIIPFEQRNVILDGQRPVKALWVSAAHVEPEYRSQGIGSNLDSRIKDEFGSNAQAVFVVREDQQSAAYRWYMKLGYRHLTNILSFQADVASLAEDEYLLLKTANEFKEYGEQLKSCFDRNAASSIGYPQRDASFWVKQLSSHYYKEHYQYSIVAVLGRNCRRVKSYALLGKTNYRDGVKRMDILECVVAPDKRKRSILLYAIHDQAKQNNCQEVRIQLAEQDELVDWVKGNGFTQRWETNLLGKTIEPGKKLPEQGWKFFQVDYI